MFGRGQWGHWTAHASRSSSAVRRPAHNSGSTPPRTTGHHTNERCRCAKREKKKKGSRQQGRGEAFFLLAGLAAQAALTYWTTRTEIDRRMDGWMDRWNGCPEYSSGECLVVLRCCIVIAAKRFHPSCELNVLCFCCCSVWKVETRK